LLAFLLDVVSNKTGAEQMKDALSKAEKESNLAAKVPTKDDRNRTDSKSNSETKKFISKATRGDQVKETSKASLSSDDRLDKIIESKIGQLEKLQKRHKAIRDAKEKLNKIKQTVAGDSASLLSDSPTERLTENIRKAEEKEKENSALEEQSDTKMLQMAKKLNTLVLKFQKKIGKHDFKGSM